MALKIGDEIPDFSLLDQSGQCRSKKDFKGKPLILFFYPKDDTPGCTVEACGFRDKYDLFKILGARVCGISNGNEESHLKFALKNKLQYPLLCDKDNILRKLFGVPKFLGLLDGRVTYVIDSKGIIRHIFEDLINGPAHIKEAISVLKDFQN
ncbi:peroxiredoxin [Prochlorococcus marinus]|uniref:peroxiredoxin n=1 Tax=Prochlorococcus marinus TaxID=1219 RepID=UPI0022B3B88F|nr:peroxiredoxin [Prochlorococcus marinus]